jgi:hypothetical protein
MQAKAIVGDRLVGFQFTPELARTRRAKAGKIMAEQEAVAFIEKVYCAFALRYAQP